MATTTSYVIDLKPTIYTAPTTNAYLRYRADAVMLTPEALAQVGGWGLRRGESWSASCKIYQEIDGVYSAFPLAISDGAAPTPEWTPAVLTTRIYDSVTAVAIGTLTTALANQVTYPGVFTLAMSSSATFAPGRYQLHGIAAWMSTTHPHTAVLSTETLFTGSVVILPPLP
jgi:hypothetical protein